MEKRRVVITGMGTVNPVGNSVSESWAAAKAGKCGIGPITRYDTSNMRVKLAGEVRGLDVDGLLGRRESKKMDRFTQLALIAAEECMADAGLNREAEDLDRCGVIFSSGIGGFETVGQAYRRGEERGYDAVSPFMIPMIISNMAAGRIAIQYGFRGMSSCVVTACAGGTNAVGDAFRHIRDGYAEVMLCGGGEAAITPLAMGGFTAMKALYEGQDPLRASIPFDAERSGFVMGEGAGALLFAVGAYASQQSSILDLHYLYIYPIHYLTASVSCIGLLELMRVLPASRILSYLGQNSLVIMCTHGPMYVLYYVSLGMFFVRKLIPMTDSVLYGWIAVAACAAEVPVIWIFNRYFSYLLGRKSKKS